MHFYGTYVLARAAGVPREDAETVACAAQFVDDSTQQDSKQHPDGGLLYGITTAHHSQDCVLNAVINPEEQRRVWIPFHFIPGGEGETPEERLLCVKDSPIANEMIQHHIKTAVSRVFGLELLGIAAHAYMDTFSHYGFSGIGSQYNAVRGDSFELIGVKNQDVAKYIENKKAAFLNKYKVRAVASFFAEMLTGSLGHGAVATYPDRPFLHWRVTFEKPRPGNGKVSDRDNPATYLEGCEKIHRYFTEFSRGRYANPDPMPFGQIQDALDRVLRFEGAKEDRIEQWRDVIRNGAISTTTPNEADILYDANRWENEKKNFHELKSSEMGIEKHAYRFHQAAALHRYYVLKDLLPKYHIAVY